MRGPGLGAFAIEGYHWDYWSSSEGYYFCNFFHKLEIVSK